MTSQDAAEALLQPVTQASLLPFFKGPISIKDAAEETGIKLNTLHARVKRYQSLGLLEVTGEVPRAGRAIKLYRTTAETFLVAYRVLKAETLEVHMTGREQYWITEFRRSFNQARYEDASNVGFEIYLDKNDVIAVETRNLKEASPSVTASNSAALVDLWSDELHLDFNDAKELQRELLGLHRKYRQKRGTHPYLLRLGLTPWAKK